MDRRTFLQSAATFSLSLLLPGSQSWAFSNPGETASKKRLIVVMLRGAVDGLNVVIPYGDSAYYECRKAIAVAHPGTESGALDLDGNFGLHPALARLMPFWENKSMAFVTSSGSPDPTRSHFDAQDYMENGIPGTKVIDSGWMNRLINVLPNNHSPVRAVILGPTVPRIFSGPESVATVEVGRTGVRKIALDRPEIAKPFEALYGLRKDALGKAFRDGMDAHNTLNSHLADDHMSMADQGAPSPAQNPNFGSKLAQLITKDKTIQVAFIAFGGWDTHINQGAGKGQLAGHLGPLGNGLADFIAGLGPIYDDTAIIIMSEFGRTARENGNGGTDHGHGNSMWILGGKVRGGRVYGKYDGLNSSRLYEGRDLPVNTDFRQVLTSILHQHMNIEPKQLEKIFPHFTSEGGDVLNLINA